ncbi:MAG: lyase family protein, partial [Dehalococcoidia bacterium]|nr:lyase family protein [Dehalococcoidia bacterium]
MLRGRFEKEPSKSAADYSASISYDRRLYRHDIAGSVAHTRMLSRAGVITDKECELIVIGLTSIREEIARGQFTFNPELEDIHMNIESRIAEKVGPEIAGKLHTARSRNDQVATDMRLYVKESVGSVVKGLRGVQLSLVELGQTNKDVALPGYTHMQQAQPVLLAHHLLAYFEMLER